ncbi:MAG: hypothetical protein IKS20_08040, partial [Victivallales bacterium]|nr:hypothetical protein [Victivallales bacterium]
MKYKILAVLAALGMAALGAAENLLTDGGFEMEGTWRGQYTIAQGKTGKGIQLLKDANTKTNCDAISLSFPVIAGTDFALTGQYKGDTFYTYAIFKLKDGKSSTIHRGHNKANDWTEFKMAGKVPPEAVSVYVILRTFNTKTPTFLDELNFMGEKQQGMKNLLKNGDFEKAGNNNGADGWRGSFTRVEGEGMNGSAAAKTLNVNKIYSEANSFPFAVRPGAPFTLSGVARGKASGTVYAYFRLKNGKSLAKYAAVPASEGWRPFTLSGNVPDDAVSCSVLCRTGNDKEPLFFDNVTFESTNPVDEEVNINGIKLIVPPEPTPDELCAREELAHYLPLVMKGRIMIGGNPLTTVRIGSASTVKTEGLADESWKIVSEGGVLHLKGIGPRGTLYATYHFLEDYLGIHWWNPSDDYV